MRRAELFIAYDRKRIAEGQTPPQNVEGLFAAVDSASEEWQAPSDEDSVDIVLENRSTAMSAVEHRIPDGTRTRLRARRLLVAF